MAYIESNMMPLGTKAPDFSLLDTVSGVMMSLQKNKGEQATVIMFICNHCPYVIHINDQLVKLANDYSKEGVGFIAISSNDVSKYPADSPEKMKENAISLKYPFPYLYDESQEVAKAFDATCTPDFFLFNSENKLVYRGQIDDSRPGNGIPTSGSDLRNAIDSVIYNRNLAAPQKPSVGCGIKWK